MIISAHLISGGVVGEAIGNPLLAFLIGIIIHFLLDAVPHFDNVLEKGRWTFKQVIFTSLDLLLALVLFFILKPAISFSSPFWWGALGGLFPDLIHNVPFWRKQVLATKWGGAYARLHDRINNETKNIFWGFFTQAITITLFVALYFMVK